MCVFKKWTYVKRENVEKVSEKNMSVCRVERESDVNQKHQKLSKN